ncbi:MAG TPA: hypothetical protein VHC44_19245 [Verrucomicrobiae bacterium]|nr:hypothetical protein [Verrucomicrobiae bacterium]
MKTKYLDIFLAFALVLIVVSGFAHTWQQATTLANYVGSVGMSADGKIICAVPSASHVVISADSGKTWALATNSPPPGTSLPGGVALSADGSKIFAVLNGNGTNRVFVSPDHGGTWIQTAFPGATNSFYPSCFIACSADGSKLVAATPYSPIYFSTNGGVDYSTSSAPKAPWSSVASSADGGLMIATASLGGVYFSGDFGASWILTALPTSLWNSVCTSSDGKWIGATDGFGSYVSSDGGRTWLTNQISGNTIACSADGTNWLITGEDIYTSTNGGTTWATNVSGSLWRAGAVSADGSEMAALGSEQGTWLGLATPSPRLNIQPQNSSLTISWIIPSTNFVLQQSLDLTPLSWASVSPGPTLNFSNLQQQVTVPAIGNSTFFRLMAQ